MQTQQTNSKDTQKCGAALSQALLLGFTNPLLHYLDMRMQFRGDLTTASATGMITSADDAAGMQSH